MIKEYDYPYWSTIRFRIGYSFIIPVFASTAGRLRNWNAALFASLKNLKKDELKINDNRAIKLALQFPINHMNEKTRVHINSQ